MKVQRKFVVGDLVIIHPESVTSYGTFPPIVGVITKVNARYVFWGDSTGRNGFCPHGHANEAFRKVNENE